jgi:threonine dehydratase
MAEIEMAADLIGTAPTIVDFLKARAFIERNYLRTPLLAIPNLSQRYGCEIFAKYENQGPVRSFKARGALYRLSLLNEDERRRGVIAASTGNHGQGVAYAGRMLSVPVTIVVPERTPALKTDNIVYLGGKLIVCGTSLYDAEEEARAIAARTGQVIIEDGEDAGLMAGAGTIVWEILDQLPNASAIVVPVGGGNLIAATAFIAKLLRPDIQIIGVQSEAAPAVCESWLKGEITTLPCTTFAGGLATSRPGMLAFSVLRELVDTFLLVGEDDLRCGVATAIATTGQLAEGAGAAPFAALQQIAPSLLGRKVVLLLTGGNLPVDELRSFLPDTSAPT